ncbi:MAG TPA: SH3 domain-containing protein [Polyangiaceae bacterium]
MTTSKSLLLAAAAALVLGAVGCASEPGDGGELLTSTADELATTGPTYTAGTELVTTAALNLRSSGSTSASILRVMPNGSHVTVRATSGANAWVAVRFNGYDGWAHTSYLVPAPNGGGGSSPGGYSSARGNKLASTALRMDGHAAGGLCALETSNSVVQSGIIPKGVTWYRNNAIDISEYMAASPGYDAKVGFHSISVSPNAVPKGSIIGWRRGQCGYSSKYGHIEISVDSTSSRACSDFCGSIKKTCGSPYVFMPTTL